MIGFLGGFVLTQLIYKRLGKFNLISLTSALNQNKDIFRMFSGLSNSLGNLTNKTETKSEPFNINTHRRNVNSDNSDNSAKADKKII